MLENVRNKFARRDEDGASAVEYGLLVAAIAAIIVLIVIALGGFIEDAFSDTCDALATNPSLANNQGGNCAS